MLLKQRLWTVVLLQFALVVLSAATAWLVRFEFVFPRPEVFFTALPLLLLSRMLFMARFKLFHGYWRYTGVDDALDVIKAACAGSLAFLVAERWVLGERSFPISVCCIEIMLTSIALIGVRVGSRALVQIARTQAVRFKRKAVVVIGAGCAAAMLLRELPRSGYTALALIDDDPAKTGVRLHGVPVRGRVVDLAEVVRCNQPDEIMIAIPSATGDQMRRITEFCDRTKVPFRTIPGLGDLLHGTATIDQLREVNLGDLLGREPVHLNLDSVRHRIAGRVVMVTGAAGSIGSELCRQLLRYAPAKLICVDQAETPLFYLERANSEAAGAKIYCVADIADSIHMHEVIRQHDVRVIFHAAAYKHVPLMEENLQEALKNNVFGLLSLMEAAEQSGCEDFLFVSSDKAVNPTSFMGCTKRIGELIVAARPWVQMRCVSVRFGNVLGSQGSVIPLFQQQIRTTRQITVTHREITRYFMTIPEAVSLVLEAFSIGGKGDILVLDMGKPIRILDMAKTMICLSGIAQEDVKIVFTGLRPGEKLFEELYYPFERRLSTSAQKVLRTGGVSASWPELRVRLSTLRAASLTGSSIRIRASVKEIVPQYQWSPPEESQLAPAAPLAGQRRFKGEREHVLQMPRGF
jgi:FlaA1/EpsC-like NDP-sugar epimerase